MAPSPRARAPYFAWLSILTGGAWTPSFSAMELVKSRLEWDASKDSKNEASTGLLIEQTLI